jgi:hypothetical protein
MILAREFGNIGYPYVKITPVLTVSRPTTRRYRMADRKRTQMLFRRRPRGWCDQCSDFVIARQVAFQSGDLYRLRMIGGTQRQVYAWDFKSATTTPAFSRDSGEVIRSTCLKRMPTVDNQTRSRLWHRDRFRVFSIRDCSISGGARACNCTSTFSLDRTYHRHSDPAGVPDPGHDSYNQSLVWRRMNPAIR